MIIFGSVRFLSKKIIKLNFFFLKKKPKPNRNQVKPTGFGLVRFGFLRAKTGSNRFGSVFPVLAWFSRFFPVLARFGSVFFQFFVGFGSVWFGFFGFLLIKPKPNRIGRFFQKFNRFNRVFFRFGFFGYFFSGFLGLIDFPVFLLTPR